MERHYGMDWLRIGAFWLLILYHVGMVFVPWGFQVKTKTPLIGAEIPMFLTSPWRLTLLFVVSGYASRALFARSRAIRAFFRSRSSRLLTPLVFGIAVIVPPQTWVELTTQHGYPHGFLHFWAHDYFRFGTLSGIVMPTWNHLWFVLYLWIYSAALAVIACLPGIGRLQAVFDRSFAGWRAILIPVAWCLLIEVVLFNRPEDTHDLVHDTVAHLRYVPAFLFGFGLAGSRVVMASLAERWKLSGTVAVGCFATIAALLLRWPDFSFPSHDVTLVFRIARHVETWTAIAALIGTAERFWNHNGAWRTTLAEGTFPFYIIHQTIIVVVEYPLLKAGVGPLAQFVILVAATVAGCWAFYLVGREIGWLRPLIGLKRTATAPAHEHKRVDAGDPWWSRRDRAQPDVA